MLLRVLVIEDDEMIGAALCLALKDAAMTIDWGHDGIDGEAAIATGGHALVLLDWNLAGRDGLRILYDMRRDRRDVPVLVLTARDNTDDRAAGFDLGADDYLVRPSPTTELICRRVDAWN